MPGTHALLSASSAHRWLNCTPSARLEEQYEEQTSVYAEEGSLAHHYAEIELKHAIGSASIDSVKYLSELKKIKSDELYNPEMDEYVGVYVSFVMETYGAIQRVCPDAELIIEGRLSFDQWVPNGYGTGDAVIVADKEIHVIDFKYGKGVAVEVVGNPQFRLYALGAYNEYSLLYGVDSITTTVVQPRLDVIASETLTAKELLDWGDEIKPIAWKAYDGEGIETIGDHCKFCKHKINCKALKIEANKMAKKAFEKVQPSTMRPKTIADLLTKKDIVIDYLKAIADWALVEVRDNGLNLPGYKLVEGRSNRKYLDEDKVVAALQEAGFNPDDFYEVKLKGVTAMDNLLAKANKKDVLDGLIVKPEGAPVLVPETDKRKEWQPKQTAEEAFKDVDLNNENGGTKE